MENPIKMDDLGVPLFLETPIYSFAGIHKKAIVFLFLYQELLTAHMQFCFCYIQIKKRKQHC